MFVINLENKSFRDVWNGQSDAKYLSQTLRPQGVLLSRYYAIGHASLPNYIAQISGQRPNPATKGDCPDYEAFDSSGTAPLGQAQGPGLRLPRVRADGCRPVKRGRENLEGVHGGYGHPVPPS